MIGECTVELLQILECVVVLLSTAMAPQLSLCTKIQTNRGKPVTTASPLMGRKTHFRENQRLNKLLKMVGESGGADILQQKRQLCAFSFFLC